MNWIDNSIKLKEIFESCFSIDSSCDYTLKDELCTEFISRLSDQNIDIKQRLIKANHVLENCGSYSREKFFEICLDENLLDESLLTDLYVSIHPYANLFSYFSENKMNYIFQKIKIPFTCVFTKDKFKDLEERIKIYRGFRTKPLDLNRCGFCWSTVEKTAYNFATGDGKISGWIISGWIDKENILGYISIRDEFEVIAKCCHVLEKDVTFVDANEY